MRIRHSHPLLLPLDNSKLFVLLTALPALAACGGGTAERVVHEELAFSITLDEGWSEPSLGTKRSGSWFTALTSSREDGAEGQFGTLRVEVLPGAARETADALADRMLEAKGAALPGLYLHRLDPLESEAGTLATWEALMQVGDEPFRARCWVLASPQGVYAVHLEGTVEFEGLLAAAEDVARSLTLDASSDMLALPDCDRCQGTGRYRDPCPTCDGTGNQETRGVLGVTNLIRCLQCGGAGGWNVDCPH